jgi:hypothetical protein
MIEQSCDAIGSIDSTDHAGPAQAAEPDDRRRPEHHEHRAGRGAVRSDSEFLLTDAEIRKVLSPGGSAVRQEDPGRGRSSVGDEGNHHSRFPIDIRR